MDNKEPLTYQKVISDIMEVSNNGNDSDTQAQVAQLCRMFSEFLVNIANHTNGYVFVTALTVSFVEMKKIVEFAEGKDKVLIQQLVEAIIGSFGKTMH